MAVMLNLLKTELRKTFYIPHNLTECG